MIVSDLALVFHILLGNPRLLHPFKGFYRFPLTDDLRMRLVKTADIHTRLFEAPLADKVDISLPVQDFWKRSDEGEDFIRIGSENLMMRDGGGRIEKRQVVIQHFILAALITLIVSGFELMPGNALLCEGIE